MIDKYQLQEAAIHSGSDCAASVSCILVPFHVITLHDLHFLQDSVQDSMQTMQQ